MESRFEKCPSEAQLRSLVAGQLALDSQKEIHRHLAQCKKCSETIGDFKSFESRRKLASVLGEPIEGPEVTVIDKSHQSVRAKKASAPENETSQSTDREPRETVNQKKPARRGNQASVPKTIGPYQVIEQIGAGGMGAVYRAIHSRMNREVALKLLPANCVGDIEAVKRFDREMQAVGRLDHPNIVTGYDAGDSNGHCYLAMEILRGVDLSTLAKNRRVPVAVGDACEIIRQVALGLQYAHGKGIFHRDVKPSNIMLCNVVEGAVDSTDYVRVKLLDLGLARFEQGDQGTLTALSQVVGTVSYMSPEQCLDSRVVDGRSDIYSLGATLYRLIVGETPWPNRLYETPGQKLQALLLMELQSVENVRPDLPVELINLIDKSLKRDPTERYQSIDDLIADLTPLAVDHDLPTLLLEANKSLADQDFVIGQQEEPRQENLKGASATAGVSGYTVASGKAAHVKKIPATASEVPTSTDWKRLGVAAAGAFVLILAAVVFWLKTDGGYLRIEADPSIDVTVDILKEGQKVGSIKTGSDGKTWWYRSGSYEIRLPAEIKDSLTLSESSFTLSRGGNPVVTISNATDSQRAAELSKNANDNDVLEAATSGEKSPATMVELRNIVEWVLGSDGTVGTDHGEFKTPTDVPAGEFELHRVGLREVDNEKARKACELIAGIRKCDQLYLNGGRNRMLTDDAMAAIGQVEQLKWLVIESAKISDAGIRKLPRMPRLQHLGLLDLLVTEQCLAVASIKFPNLASLNLFSTSLRGNDLKALTSMENLTKVDLITPGIAKSLIEPLVSTNIDTLSLRGVERFEKGVGEVLGSMPELSELQLQNCKFNDLELAGLSEASKLKFLYLDDSGITVDGLRVFLDENPNVIVYLNDGKSPLQKLSDLPQVKDVSGDW